MIRTWWDSKFGSKRCLVECWLIASITVIATITTKITTITIIAINTTIVIVAIIAITILIKIITIVTFILNPTIITTISNINIATIINIAISSSQDRETLKNQRTRTEGPTCYDAIHWIPQASLKRWWNCSSKTVLSGKKM